MSDLEEMQAKAERALAYLEEHGDLGHWLYTKPSHGWSCGCGDPDGDEPQREWVGPH